jgi:SAM-dependent methyltransferase
LSTRWEGTDAPRGEVYDAQWDRLAAAGRSIHGEADLIDALLRERAGRRVLDAGCGTGRVAIELARRGITVVGVDLDASMLDRARRDAPDIEWIAHDLATLDLGRTFDVVVMAGNVPIFTPPGTHADLVAGCARHLGPDGALVAGFQLGRGYDLAAYDAHCAAAGLALRERFATWDREAPGPNPDYAVSVHRPG